MSDEVKLQHFILVFDHAVSKARPVEKFGASVRKAIARYEELEAEYRHNPNMDIVLVASDALSTVRVTHANYFDGSASAAKLDRLIADYLQDVTA